MSMQSTSALVDLKAELTRKENELKERRTTASGKEKGCKTFAKIQQGTRARKGKRRKDEKQKKEEEKEDGRIADASDETLILLEEARRKLEAKSKIYEKMQKGEMEDLEDIYGETKFLVDFQRKYYTDVDDDEIDEGIKKKNSSYNESAHLDVDDSTPNNSALNNSSLLFEINEAQREKMREKWEKEQEDLLNGPVHYEHVKFDEVRNLGTGYFAFSKDEAERTKQMEDFEKMRQSTKSAHIKAEELKRKRKAALQERLEKVKKRKCGKVNGEELHDETLQSTECTSQLINAGHTAPMSIMKTDVETNMNDTSVNLEDEQNDERTLKECRKMAQDERAWDKGKTRTESGVGFVKEIFKKSKAGTLYNEMVQEKRDERLEEFAPPNFY